MTERSCSATVFVNQCTDGVLDPSKLLGLSLPEVRNRATIAGVIEVSRVAGVVTVTFRYPVEPLERLGLPPFAQEQYDLYNSLWKLPGR